MTVSVGSKDCTALEKADHVEAKEAGNGSTLGKRFVNTSYQIFTAPPKLNNSQTERLFQHDSNARR
jgi:hypothetical protein